MNGERKRLKAILETIIYEVLIYKDTKCYVVITDIAVSWATYTVYVILAADHHCKETNLEKSNKPNITNTSDTLYHLPRIEPKLEKNHVNFAN